jgi:cyanophycinase
MRHWINKHLFLIPYSLVLLCTGCAEKQNAFISSTAERGGLFIIGGGARPPDMIQNMLKLSGIDSSGYIVIFPQASEDPDTAFYYSSRQFRPHGISSFCNTGMNGRHMNDPALLDSVRQAPLIYISGGDQSRFMEELSGSPLLDALFEARQQGALIAGTSAGAAVMSRKMITGDQLLYPEYTGAFRTIESGNMVLADGLGFLENAVIDQHFIRRMRLNRLISVVLEHPELTGIGIDESTALHVKGDSGTVYGESQVIVLQHPGGKSQEQGTLLGARDLKIHVLLPGDRLVLAE